MTETGLAKKFLVLAKSGPELIGRAWGRTNPAWTTACGWKAVGLLQANCSLVSFFKSPTSEEQSEISKLANRAFLRRPTIDEKIAVAINTLYDPLATI